MTKLYRLNKTYKNWDSLN